MEAELEKVLRDAGSELFLERLKEHERSHGRRPEVTTSNGLQALFERSQQVRTCDFVW